MNPWQKFYKPKGLKERFKNKNQKKATKQKTPINKPNQNKSREEGKEELLGLLSLNMRLFCVTAYTQHQYLLVRGMFWPYAESGQLSSSVKKKKGSREVSKGLAYLPTQSFVPQKAPGL